MTEFEPNIDGLYIRLLMCFTDGGNRGTFKIQYSQKTSKIYFHECYQCMILSQSLIMSSLEMGRVCFIAEFGLRGSNSKVYNEP